MCDSFILKSLEVGFSFLDFRTFETCLWKNMWILWITSCILHEMICLYSQSRTIKKRKNETFFELFSVNKVKKERFLSLTLWQQMRGDCICSGWLKTEAKLIWINSVAHTKRPCHRMVHRRNDTFLKEIGFIGILEKFFSMIRKHSADYGRSKGAVSLFCAWNAIVMVSCYLGWKRHQTREEGALLSR